MLHLTQACDAGKSKKGELSLFPETFQVLSPCLHMLPLRRLDNQVLIHLYQRPLPPAITSHRVCRLTTHAYHAACHLALSLALSQCHAEPEAGSTLDLLMAIFNAPLDYVLM